MLGDKRLARQGVMSQALRLLADTFGHGWYELDVLSSNTTAISFYEKNGFRVVDGWGTEMLRMGGSL
jgi:ribosomal protein S18 acetylase RimI-like enzyme